MKALTIFHLINYLNKNGMFIVNNKIYNNKQKKSEQKINGFLFRQLLTIVVWMQFLNRWCEENFLMLNSNQIQQLPGFYKIQALKKLYNLKSWYKIKWFCWCGPKKTTYEHFWKFHKFFFLSNRKTKCFWHFNYKR